MNSNIKFVIISLILGIFLSVLLFYSLRPQKINSPLPEIHDVSIMFEDKITPSVGPNDMIQDQENSSQSAKTEE